MEHTQQQFKFIHIKSAQAGTSIYQLLTSSIGQTILRSTSSSLSTMSLGMLTRRILFYRYFNLELSGVLNLMDLTPSRCTDSSSFAHRLSYLRALILQSVKFDFMSDVFDLTCKEQTKNKPRVVIDRLVQQTTRSKQQQQQQQPASQQGSGSDVAILNKHSIFIQSMRQLYDVPARQLLQPKPHGSSPHTALDLKFVGEHVVGEGGPYRQV